MTEKYAYFTQRRLALVYDKTLENKLNYYMKSLHCTYINIKKKE